MFKSLISTVTIFVLLATLFGQAMAYTTMPCEMDNANHQTMMAMDHSAMQNNMDCCDTQCTCPANACLSIVYLEVDASLNLGLYATEPRLTRSTSSPSSRTKTLFAHPFLPNTGSVRPIFGKQIS